MTQVSPQKSRCIGQKQKDQVEAGAVIQVKIRW